MKVTDMKFNMHAKNWFPGASICIKVTNFHIFSFEVLFKNDDVQEVVIMHEGDSGQWVPACKK